MGQRNTRGVFGESPAQRKNPRLLASLREGAYRKGPSCGEIKEKPMGLFLYLEASQPTGATYRLGLGCSVHPTLASMIAALARLF